MRDGDMWDGDMWNEVHGGCSTAVVDCERCPVAGTGCDDCVVTFLLGRDPDDAVVYDHATERALRLLREGGLLGEVVGERRVTVAG